MINGTQLIASIGAAAVERAGALARQADVVAAMTLEVLKGTSRAFDSDVHRLRPHKGQIEVARRLRALLHSDTYPSEIAGETETTTRPNTDPGYMSRKIRKFRTDKFDT